MFDDADKELPFSGVFAVRDGRIALVTDELQGPNGLAFSPDERYLYVGNWDPENKVVMRYELGPDDRVIAARVLFDMTHAAGERSTGSRSTGWGTCTRAGRAGSG
jgi:gluconolactonase